MKRLDKAKQFLSKVKAAMDTRVDAQIAELEKTAQKRPLTDGEIQMMKNMTNYRDKGRW